MIEDILKNIEQSIKSQMAERFGLTDNQTAESTKIISEQIRLTIMDAFSKGNFQELAAGISANMENNPLFQKLNSTIMPDLINKVGLSQEIAQKVKDFSLKAFVDGIKEEFMNNSGNVDISKILTKINMNNIPGAENLMGMIGKYFK